MNSVIIPKKRSLVDVSCSKKLKTLASCADVFGYWAWVNAWNDPDSAWESELYFLAPDEMGVEFPYATSAGHWVELTLLPGGAGLKAEYARIMALDFTMPEISEPDIAVECYYGGAWHSVVSISDWPGVDFVLTQWQVIRLQEAPLSDITKIRIKANQITGYVLLVMALRFLNIGG